MGLATLVWWGGVVGQHQQITATMRHANCMVCTSSNTGKGGYALNMERMFADRFDDRYGMARYGMLRHGMTWYGIAWYGMV